jgi:hypothetical protein
VKAVIAERVDRIEQHGHRPGRGLSLDRQQYRRRNVIEPAVGRVKHPRRIATRSGRLAPRYEAMFTVALIARYATRFLFRHYLAELRPRRCSTHYATGRM